MSAIIIIFVVIAVLLSVQKNKQNQEAERRKRAQNVAAAEQSAAPVRQAQTARTPQTVMTSTLKPAPTASGARSGEQRPVQTKMPQAAFAEGAGRGSMSGYSTEGRGSGGSLPPTAMQGERTHNVQATTHVVRPLTETKHAHIESSMTGIEPDCAPDAEEVSFTHIDAYDMEAGESHLPYGLLLDQASVTRGLVMAEILAKPKALRK